jgi:ABC-2 type transport system permease protein
MDSPIITLLSPFWLSWKNDFMRRGKKSARRLFLFCAAAAVWLGIYWITHRALGYFQSVYDLGPALAYQLLLIVLLTFFSMLLFSNVITSLSTFFLAGDLDLVLSTPIPTEAFYYSRLIATAITSSWMVLFFTVPVFAAYGSVFGGGMIFYLWLLLILPLFLIIPAAIGVLLIHLLVYILPARRIRAAAEVGVGLAIVLLLYRNLATVNVDDADLMKY